MSHRAEHAAVMGWFAVIAACVFWKVTLAHQVLYWGDIFLYFLPMVAFAHRWLTQGILPLWNPHTLFGQPFLGNPQEWLLYPSTLFLPLMHPASYLSWSTVLHLWLAGAGMWFYLRSMQAGAGSALLGSTAWVLCGAFVPRAQFPGMFQTIALLGWLLWATEQAVQRKSAGAGATLAVVLALVWLAGHAQMAYMNTLVAMAWAFWRWYQLGKDRRALLTFAAGVVGGVLLTAGHWLPMLQLLQETPRAQLSVWAVNRFPLHPEQLLLALVPDLYGTPWLGNWLGRGNYWEVAWAVGIVPLISALSAWRSRPEARFWLVVALVSVWLSLGPHGGLYFVAYYLLPGMKVFHDPARWLILADFALCTSAALGWQTLCYSRRWLWLPLLLAGVGLLWIWQGAQLTQWTASMDPIRIRRPETLTPQLVGSAHQTALYAIARNVVVATLAVLILRFAPRWRLPLGIALLLVEMMPLAMQSNPTCDIRAFMEAPRSAHAVIRSGGRLFVPDQLPMWRRYVSYLHYGSGSVEHVRRWQEMLGSNIGMMWGIREASGYEPVPVKRGVGYLAQLAETWKQRPFASDVMDRLCRAGVGAVAIGEDANSWRVVPLPHSCSRAWLLPETRLNVTDISPQEVHIDADAPGRVVLMDTAYPGWKVWVNGKPQPILVHEQAFRLVEVPSVPASVVWRYEPDTFRIGLYLSLAGCCIIGGIAGFALAAGKSCDTQK